MERIHEPIPFWKPGAVSELPVSASAMNKNPKAAKIAEPNNLMRPIRFRCAPSRSVTFGSVTRFFAFP